MSIAYAYSNISPFGYAGEVRENSGLTYLRNRYYDEETGTFMTLDPIKDGLNWYAYCAGNPVMFVDPWGLWNPDDSELPEEIQIIINGEKKDGSGGLTQAWNLANERGDYDAMRYIHDIAESLREYSCTDINRVMPLLQSEAVYGAGHTAVLLINEKGQGILLSYWSENNKAEGPGEMRIAVLSSSEWNNTLYKDAEVDFVASNGKIQHETYSDNLYLTVSQDDGRNALKTIAKLFNNPGQYHLTNNNCDHQAMKVVESAGKFYDKCSTPNVSFNSTSMYHTQYRTWYFNKLEVHIIEKI